MPLLITLHPLFSSLYTASLSTSVCCRSLNPLELIKYQDLALAVAKLLERVPGINQQTAQIAIQQTLGDIDAAAAFLNAAMNKSHLPNSGDPNVMASLLLQNLPPGFSLPANSGEVVQAMAAAMAKANELQLATDRLAAAAIHSQQQIKVYCLPPYTSTGSRIRAGSAPC